MPTKRDRKGVLGDPLAAVNRAETEPGPDDSACWGVLSSLRAQHHLEEIVDFG